MGGQREEGDEFGESNNVRRIDPEGSDSTAHAWRSGHRSSSPAQVAQGPTLAPATRLRLIDACSCKLITYG